MAITRVKPAGWGVGEKLTSSQMNDVDANVLKALDKRSGETDTLSSVVTVDGQLALSAGGSIYLTDSGCVVDADANGAYIQASFAGAKIRTLSGGRLELGDNDWPQLSTTHTGRTVYRQLGWATWGSTSDQSDVSFTSSIFRPFAATTDYSIGLFGSSFDVVNTGSTTLSRLALFDLGPYLINGATLTTAAVSLLGYSGHAGLPARMPRIAVARMTATTPLTQVLLHAGNSFVDSSANTAAYQAAHTVTATCTTNNVIDKTSYRYALCVWNEGGTNALAFLSIVNATITQSIVDLRPA